MCLGYLSGEHRKLPRCASGLLTDPLSTLVLAQCLWEWPTDHGRACDSVFYNLAAMVDRAVVAYLCSPATILFALPHETGRALPSFRVRWSDRTLLPTTRVNPSFHCSSNGRQI